MTESRTPQEMAHAARGSLSVIRLTTETLLEKGHDEETRAELETILKQVDQLAEIMTELSRTRR